MSRIERTFDHDHDHISHHHRGDIPIGGWEHWTHRHTHEHTHNERTHSDDYSTSSTSSTADPGARSYRACTGARPATVPA